MVHDNPRRSNSARRNKVRRRVLREEDVCWLCGREVDKTRDKLLGQHAERCPGVGCMGCRIDPWRPEVDEVLPVSRGGDPYDRANCRLAHRLCNQRRGNKMAAPPVQLAPLQTNRSW